VAETLPNEVFSQCFWSEDRSEWWKLPGGYADLAEDCYRRVSLLGGSRGFSVQCIWPEYDGGKHDVKDCQADLALVLYLLR